MRFDIYQKETEQVARKQAAILETAREKLEKGEKLNPIVENGVLHALTHYRNLVEKAKHILKSLDISVPVSSYEVFEALNQQNRLKKNTLNEWNAIIGLRNRIVHDYMYIDFNLIGEIVRRQQYQFVIDFLLEPV